MSNLKMHATLRNNMLDEITARAGGSAILKILSGTQPSGGGAETTVLAQLTCNATFAPAASRRRIRGHLPAHPRARDVVSHLSVGRYDLGPRWRRIDDGRRHR